MSTYQALFVAVRFLIFAALAVYVWRWDDCWMNGVLRSGIVLYCAANALTLGDSLTIAQRAGMPPLLVLRLRLAGVAAASLVAGVGALITWSPVGYLAAGCFFFLSLLFGWLAGKLRP